MSALSEQEITDIEAQIKSKGDFIRQLKADGVDKVTLAPHVEELLALKGKIVPPEKVKKETKKKPLQKKQSKGKKDESEMTDSELRQNRLAKAQAMRDEGVEPFEYTYDPTHSALELQNLYEGKLNGGEEDIDSNVAVAGRIMTKRGGNLTSH